MNRHTKELLNQLESRVSDIQQTLDINKSAREMAEKARMHSLEEQLNQKKDLLSLQENSNRLGELIEENNQFKQKQLVVKDALREILGLINALEDNEG